GPTAHSTSVPGSAWDGESSVHTQVLKPASAEQDLLAEGDFNRPAENGSAGHDRVELAILTTRVDARGRQLFGHFAVEHPAEILPVDHAVASHHNHRFKPG